MTVIGWLALGWQAGKRMQHKTDIEKFPELRRQLALRRNYCFLIIFAGIILLAIGAILTA